MRRCPACGTVVPQTTKACHSCGGKLPPTARENVDLLLRAGGSETGDAGSEFRMPTFEDEAPERVEAPVAIPPTDAPVVEQRPGAGSVFGPRRIRDHQPAVPRQPVARASRLGDEVRPVVVPEPQPQPDLPPAPESDAEPELGAPVETPVLEEAAAPAAEDESVEVAPEVIEEPIAAAEPIADEELPAETDADSEPEEPVAEPEPDAVDEAECAAGDDTGSFADLDDTGEFQELAAKQAAEATEDELVEPEPAEPEPVEDEPELASTEEESTSDAPQNDATDEDTGHAEAPRSAEPELVEEPAEYAPVVVAAGHIDAQLLPEVDQVLLDEQHPEEEDEPAAELLADTAELPPLDADEIGAAGVLVTEHADESVQHDLVDTALVDAVEALADDLDALGIGMDEGDLDPVLDDDQREQADVVPMHPDLETEVEDFDSLLSRSYAPVEEDADAEQVEDFDALAATPAGPVLQPMPSADDSEPLVLQPEGDAKADPDGPVVQPVTGPVMEPVSPADAADAAKWYPILDASPVFAEGTDEEGEDEDADDGQGENRELELPIDGQFQFHSLPAGGEQVVNLLLTLTPDGAPLVSAGDGSVAHVILALDLSASMNHPDKYPMLTQALTGMLYELQRPGQGEVLLSVVLFAYGAETLIKAVPASQIDPRELLNSIDRSELRFGRYTDIVGALSRAGRIAYDQLQVDKVTPVRIYVMTDGQPQDMERAQQVANKVRRMPVDVNGLAFGADADVASLQKLVSGGRGGTVKHVRSDTIGQAFGRIAEVAQKVVATRALVNFQLRSGVVGGKAYRFRPGRHAYGDTAFDAGTRFKTDLGTLEAGRSYTLLFQLRVPKTMQSETEIGDVTVRVPGFGGARTFERSLSIARHVGDDLPAQEPIVAEAVEILEALDHEDPEATIRALRTRRKLYEQERRDPMLIKLIDRAIAEIEERGTLDGMSTAEQAALMAHTCTVGGGGGRSGGKPTARREFRVT